MDILYSNKYIQPCEKLCVIYIYDLLKTASNVCLSLNFTLFFHFGHKLLKIRVQFVEKPSKDFNAFI